MAIQAANEFLALLDAELKDVQHDFKVSRGELAIYMSERAQHLSLAVNEPGFDRVVLAERNNVALRAGLLISENASSLNDRLLGLIGGALRIMAIALV